MSNQCKPTIDLIERLRLGDGTSADHELLLEAADALEALAQPEQEPVAWLHWLNGPVRLFLNKDEAMLELERLNRDYPVDAEHRKMRPLVLGDTTPPQRKPFNHHEFGYWWFEYGSGLHPLEGEDQEEHAYRVATAAWQAAHNIKE